MSRSRFRPLAFCGALLLGACSTSAPDESGGFPGPDAGGFGGDCTPMACGESECGMRDDGCGMTIDCGPCDGSGQSCVSDGCAADACGIVTDNCGEQIDCGPCDDVCLGDSFEQNDSQEMAFFVAELDESGGASDEDFTIPGANVAPDDLDWYQISMRDVLPVQDPNLDLKVTSDGETGLFVEVIVECVHGDQEADPSCDGGLATSEGCELEVGAGESRTISLSYNCLGTTSEDAEALVVISPTCDGEECGGVCSGYSASGAVY